MLRVENGELPFSEIQRLFDEKVTEGYEIDYKQTISTSDSDIRELLDDLVSFANTNGGWLLIGISEIDNGTKVGYPVALVDHEIKFSQFKQKVDQISADNIAPRLPDLQYFEVNNGQGKTVIAVRVGASTLRPHIVERGKRMTCSRRNSFGKQPMDAYELREAIVRSDTIGERFDRFLNHRRLLLESNSYFIRFQKPYLAVHLAPRMSFEQRISLTTEQLKLAHESIGAFHESAYSKILNAEGLLALGARPTDDTSLYGSFTQLIRHGQFESVTSCVFSEDQRNTSSAYFLAHLALVDAVHACILNLLQLLQAINIPGEVLLSLNLEGIRDYQLTMQTRFRESPKFGVPRLVLPTIILPSSDPAQDLKNTLDPWFQLIAQAGGYWEFDYKKLRYF